MDLIYENAYLTIVAAGGDNANAGLPGVVEGVRLKAENLVQVAPNIHLGIHIYLEQRLKVTAYRTRGWTFQEEKLSRRTLYFVDNKVSFRCQRITFNEDCVDEVGETPSARDITNFSLRGNEPRAFYEYSNMLEAFSSRLLTKQTDVLNAMAGIMRRFSDKFNWGFLEGLPTTCLDLFLLFTRQKAHTRRRHGFPSYSWAGWIGPIQFDTAFNTQDWPNERTWIVWYTRRSGVLSTLVWDPGANSWLRPYGGPIPRYRQRKSFDLRSELRLQTSRTTPTGDLDIELAAALPSYPVLQFWTLVVYLEMDEMDIIKGRSKMVDRIGSVCGFVMLDGFEENTFFDQDDGKSEFVVLSVAEKLSTLAEGSDTFLNSILDSAEHGDGNYYYNVMLIERDRLSIAERRGLGFIYQSSIGQSLNPGPEWKEIILK